MGGHRTGTVLGWGVLAALVLARPALADRPPTPQVLAHAQRQIDQGDFENALITLQDGLSSPDNSNEELVELYWRIGEVYVYLGRDDDARDTFTRLLYVNPDFAPPRLTSPRVKTEFEQVRQVFLTHGQVLAIHLLPPRITGANQPIEIPALLLGMRPGFRGRIYFRPALSDAWQWAPLSLSPPPTGRFIAVVPGFPAGATLEYYAEVQSSDGQRMQGDGSSLSPRSLTIPGGPAVPVRTVGPAASATPWYAHWWIWGVVGAVVAGGGALAYVELQSKPATMHLTVQVSP